MKLASAHPARRRALALEEAVGDGGSEKENDELINH